MQESYSIFLILVKLFSIRLINKLLITVIFKSTSIMIFINYDLYNEKAINKQNKKYVDKERISSK